MYEETDINDCRFMYFRNSFSIHPEFTSRRYELRYKTATICSSVLPLGMAECGANGSLIFDVSQDIYIRYRIQYFCSRTANGEINIPA